MQASNWKKLILVLCLQFLFFMTISHLLGPLYREILLFNVLFELLSFVFAQCPLEYAIFLKFELFPSLTLLVIILDNHPKLVVHFPLLIPEVIHKSLVLWVYKMSC